MTRPMVFAMMGRPSQKKLKQKSKSSFGGKMLILELLGTLSLRDETRPVPVSAQQKKQSGLLAILAVAGKQGLSRDRIETYLWPERAGDNARHSLDQAVYSIRNALGTDVIVSTGRELRLNPELVQVDAWEFEEAIRAGQRTVAAGLYKGPLLDGFHLADSRELESWIDASRSRLRDDYQRAVEFLARDSAESGDHAQSVMWSRKLVNSDPLLAGATKKLMLALAATGDRAGAVKQARLYQGLVKQELGIEPDLEIGHLAETLSRPPSSKAATPSVRAKAPEAADNPSITPAVSARTPEGTKESSYRNRRLVYALFALAVLISGAAVWGSIHTRDPYYFPYRYGQALLAYIGGSAERLLILPRNELHATAIPKTDGAYTPFFSPDGKRVGFLRQKSIWIASLSGGEPIEVGDSLNGVAGASWGSDGFIYADGFESKPLVRVEAREGAAAKWFTALDTAKGEVDHLWPHVLPNGKGVLFTVILGGKYKPNGKSSFAVAVADIPSGKHRIIIEDAVYPVYTKSGSLLYVTADQTLMMVPFNQHSMKVTGEPTPLIEGMRLGTFGATDLAVSSTGTLVYSRGPGPKEHTEILWFTRDGKITPVDSEWQGRFELPALSPDGKQIAVSRSPDGLSADIWIKHLDGGPTTRLTQERLFNTDPSWTPDGRSVTFSGTTSDGPETWTQRADGSAEAVRQFPQRRGLWGAHWAPDGKWLIFFNENKDTGGDISGIRPGIDTTPVPLVAGKFSEVLPDLSPDGRWLAYQSDETGMYQIYVVPFPNTKAAKWAITSKGGVHPKWSHSGNELFYRDFSGDMFVVGIETSPTLSSGRPRRLFEAKRGSFPFVGYAVSADDKRLLMIRYLAPTPSDKLSVVENWFEELNAKSRK